MLTTVKKIYDFIDTVAPFQSAMDFDNCGILAGDANTQVKTALVALDITKDVVEEAVQKKAQLIISPCVRLHLTALQACWRRIISPLFAHTQTWTFPPAA